MKKNIQTGNKKSILESFGLLLIGIALVGLIYGGLSINKLQKQNQTMVAKQSVLENKIVELESQIIDDQNKVVKISNDLEKVSSDLANNKKNLAYYKQLAFDNTKQILGTTDTNTGVDQAINITPAIQTVTKKVYVKEKPKYEASVTIKGVGSYKVAVVADDTAFSILKKAASQYGFKIEYQTYDFGVFVTSIAGEKPTGNQYWAFYYNGRYSQVGASDQKVSANDTTFWQLETF